MAFNIIAFNDIKLNDDSFDVYDVKTINHVRCMTCPNRFKQRKACKKEISK